MKNLLLTLLIGISIMLSSCKGDDSSPVGLSSTPAARILQGSGFAANTKIAIFASDTLRVGYNQLYLQFADSASGSVLQTMNTTVTPMMYMTTMSHSCPVEQCGSRNAVDNCFQSAVVFSMPSSAMEPWKIKVAFADSLRHVSGTIEIPITVVGSKMVNMFVAPDSTRYIVTMKKMERPKVGMNDCEFLVHKRQSMMMFPAVTDVTLEMTPDMPSMGHGSPGNVNPSHNSMGHYKGTVNFTMTGEWRVTLVLKQVTSTLGSVVFWVTL